MLRKGALLSPLKGIDVRKGYKKYIYFLFHFISFIIRHPEDAIYIRRVSDAETKPK